jgi:hypothetical protein
VRGLGCIVFVLAAACGPKVHMDDSPFEEDDPKAGAAIDEPRAPTYEELPEAPPGVTAREGSIDRAALIAVLDAGPGPLLSHFEVAAETDGERFEGWRLVAFDPKHRDFEGVDLVPGDVLVALNGAAIARPDELQTIWDGMRTADVITADIRRGATRFQLRWTVTTPAPATTP